MWWCPRPRAAPGGRSSRRTCLSASLPLLNTPGPLTLLQVLETQEGTKPYRHNSYIQVEDTAPVSADKCTIQNRVKPLRGENRARGENSRHCWWGHSEGIWATRKWQRSHVKNGKRGLPGRENSTCKVPSKEQEGPVFSGKQLGVRRRLCDWHGQVGGSRAVSGENMDIRKRAASQAPLHQCGHVTGFWPIGYWQRSQVAASLREMVPPFLLQIPPPGSRRGEALRLREWAPRSWSHGASRDRAAHSPDCTILIQYEHEICFYLVSYCYLGNFSYKKVNLH